MRLKLVTTLKFSEAFREVMFRYELSGIELAERSGLTPAQISGFRNGGNLRTDSLEKILAVFPQDAKEYFLELVATDRESSHIPLPQKSLPSSNEGFKEDL